MTSDYDDLDIWRGLPNPGTPPFDLLLRFCEQHPVAVKSSLPWMAAELSESSGFDSMLNFVLSKSGTNVYVSHDRDRFNESYGLSLTTKEHSILLTNADSRGAVLVPSAFGIFSALRRTAIMLYLSNGVSDREIARRCGASLRAIKQERRRRRTDALSGIQP